MRQLDRIKLAINAARPKSATSLYHLEQPHVEVHAYINLSS